LRRHLRFCTDCRDHAAGAGEMSSRYSLPLSTARPSAQFTAEFIEKTTRRSRRNTIMKPVYSAGGLAVMFLFMLAAWFIIQNNSLTTTLDDKQQELFDAVEAGDPVEVDRLLSGFKDLDIRDKESRALLPFATMTGDLVIVQLLLDHGADVDITMRPSGAGRTALMEAAVNNRGAMVELLVKEGANVNLQESESGFSALHFASGFNATRIIIILLENGADPNVQAENGWTPLHNAARYGHIGASQALIYGGAEVDMPDNEGLTPIMVLIKRGNTLEIRRYLTSLRVSLLKSGADPNRQDYNGNTALHHAVMANLRDAIPLLINYGASVNVKNNDGQTPLDLAEYEVTKAALREAGANE
jgi:ankyrin repeat protein